MNNSLTPKGENGNKHSFRRIKLFGCLVLLVSALFVSVPMLTLHKAEAASSATAGIVLTLKGRPPILPSDGGTYSALVLEFENVSSNQPYIPQSNITIYLSSSDPRIGTVPQSVVFPSGSLYTEADFTSTTIAGQTTITALAQDFPLANYIVTTSQVGGIPTSLQIYLSPSQIPPNKIANANVIVQAVDAFGNPIKLSQNLTVGLSLSDSRFGSIPSSVVIPAGQSFGSVTFNPTYLAGSTQITASAVGYSSSSAVMTTVGSVARQLVLTVAPALIAAMPSETATLSVQLQANGSQTPAIASSPVSVVLTSSDTSVAQLPSPIITIPAGSSYTTVSVKAGGSSGSSTITASAQGYQTGYASIGAVAAANTSATGLSVSFTPNTLLPDNATYAGAVVVELLSSGAPVTATSPVTVYARSSDNGTMQVSTTPAIIQTGSTHVAINISTTYRPGSAVITAQSVGLGSDSQSLVSYGLIANSIGLQVSPNPLLSDGQTQSSIIVSLLNSGSGAPAAAVANTTVNLVSTNTAIGQVQSWVTIPIGLTYARADFTTTYGASGSTLIVASSSNFSSINTTLAVVSPPASKLALYSIPGSILANGKQYSNTIVQLVDQNGNPEKTDVPVTVQLALQNVTTGEIPAQVTIEPGNTYATIPIVSTWTASEINIVAYANGFQTGTTSVKAILIPMTVQAYVPLPRILFRGETNVTLYVNSQGFPLSGANVNWSVVRGSLINVVNQTDSSGFASATFVGSVIGGTQVSFVASKPGYQTVSGNASFDVISPLNATVPPTTTSNNILLMQVLGVPLYILIIPIAVAAGAGGFFFIRKRRKAASDSVSDDEDEDEE